MDATLTLNVTPHVIPFDKTIRLEIKATKNSVGAAVSTAGPTIDKKEATTEVLLRDGETTVLGGIFEETRSDSSQGIPWFNRIPFLGWLFKNEGDIASGDTSGHSPTPATSDWDGDGKRDLVLGAQEGHFYFLKNPRSR